MLPKNNFDFNSFPPEERIPLSLSRLYERFGYSKYRMSALEPYDMYRENKSFLKSEGIITFTDLNGRLMALKPDVTMSIVKNVSDERETEKLYYIENVFRLSFGGGEYVEINQIGLECIGADTGYAQAEVVGLAVRSLEAVGGRYVLSLSHLGLVESFSAALGLDGARVLEACGQKNRGLLLELAQSAGLDENSTELLCSLSSFCDPIATAVAELSGYSLNADCALAIDELRRLAGTLKASGCEANVMLDFSVVNDLDYYNGIVFNGYIKGAPRAVLSGGRYDRLMSRFGKKQGALGFALYLGELDRALREDTDYDVDTLLIYGDAPADEVALAVKELLGTCGSVRAEKAVPPEIRAGRICTIDSIRGKDGCSC